MQEEQSNKPHIAPHKRDKKNPDTHNIKAFGYARGERARQAVAHQLNIEQIRLFQPETRAVSSQDPPMVVAVQGPPGCGKSLLIRCLVKRYSDQSIHEIKGPVTVVANRSQRLTFLEVPCDLNAMTDSAKVADLVLLVVNAEHGFEMETFEFLNLLLSHGFPKVIGVITHLDLVDRTVGKAIKARFRKELNTQVKVYKLEKLIHGKYEKKSIVALGRLLNQNKLRVLNFRKGRGYVLADRAEQGPGGTSLLFGYVRGDGLSTGQVVHIAGAGDFPVASIREIEDPCPLCPKATSQRTLRNQERRLYAPMSEVGGLVIDDDAIYVDLPRNQTHFTKPTELGLGPDDAAALEKEVAVTKGVQLVREMQDAGKGSEEEEEAKIPLFAGVMVSSNSGHKSGDPPPRDEDGADESEEEEARAEVQDAEEEEEQPGLANEEDDGEPVVPQGEIKPGKYARIEFAYLPHAFFEVFDPTKPIVIGGLLESELGEPGQQWVKIKRHRFYARKPKSSDPMVMTIGWRRFQVLPIFFNEERGGRNRFLKYMPDFLPCWATFYAPPSSINIGVTAFQHIKEHLETFRVTATGVTVEPMGDGTVVKKLRVNGHPSNIYEKTAKIADMFTSPIEATQFVGGLVRTVSGIRGVIKKVERNGVIRCTFEDTLKPSDIVFLNTWVKVVPTDLFTPINSLLSNEWNLVRTTAELRAERGLRPEYKQDSVYQEVERPELPEQVLRVPAGLKSQLPYAVKKQFEQKPAQRAQILNEDEAAILDIVRKTSELYQKKRQEQEKTAAAAAAAKKRAEDAEEAIRMHKRTQKKQDFFRRNPKKAKK
jgi:ribosome biogenesis protein BMS1